MVIDVDTRKNKSFYSLDSDVNKLKYDKVRDTFDNIEEHEVPDHAIKVSKEA